MFVSGFQAYELLVLDLKAYDFDFVLFSSLLPMVVYVRGESSVWPLSSMAGPAIRSKRM